MKRVIQTVEFTVEIPDDVDPETLTIEFPLGLTFVHDSHGPLVNATITGYTTTNVEEVE